MAPSIKTCFLVSLFVVSVCLGGVAAVYDNGFGTRYNWLPNLESALEAGKNENKPIMLIIHKSWCGACKSLKPRFAASDELLDLSRYFIMVNLMDDDEPTDNIYQPDGSYIPRIIFMKPDGSVMEERYNELGSEQHKYFYGKTDQIAITMKKVLTHMNVKPTDKSEEEREEL